MRASSPSSFFLLALPLLPTLLSAQAPEPPAAMAAITKQELLAHATFLASDELAGRLTGSPGQEAAAKYIAAHFAKLGLEPLGEPLADGAEGARSFLQYYPIERTYVQPETVLDLGGLKLQQGFAVLGGQPMVVSAKGPLRFVGLGRLRGPNADAEEADVAGAVCVVAIKPPKGNVKKDLSVEQKFGMSFGVFGQLGRTSKALAKAGAAAIVFVQAEDPIGLSDVLNYLALSPGKDSIVATFPGADPGMGGLGGMLGGADGAPAVVLSVPHSLQLLERLGVSVEALQQFLAGDGKGDGKLEAAAQDLTGSFDLRVAVDKQARASNVVALLRGSDPELSKEAIVYSAHMDHVGVRLDGDVFNGADDNASGSAGLLAIATAFANHTERPRRSIVFLSVSGEELGLWGSAYFAENPTWPLEQIVANVNTDMIGRNGPESSEFEVSVTPSNRHSHFSTIVRDAARFGAGLGLKFTSGDKYYSRSDHYNFAKKGVPVVFFCNGEHEDYHQVTDHADKLDGDKMERIARLAFWTGWSTANADARPERLGKQRDWLPAAASEDR
jgi:hypothetical protein